MNVDDLERLIKVTSPVAWRTIVRSMLELRTAIKGVRFEDGEMFPDGWFAVEDALSKFEEDLDAYG